jgi:hypothetical protein
VGSDPGAVVPFGRTRFPSPSPEPDVRLPPHPALHKPIAIVQSSYSSNGCRATLPPRSRWPRCSERRGALLGGQLALRWRIPATTSCRQWPVPSRPAAGSSLGDTLADLLAAGLYRPVDPTVRRHRLRRGGAGRADCRRAGPRPRQGGGTGGSRGPTGRQLAFPAPADCRDPRKRAKTAAKPAPHFARVDSRDGGRGDGPARLL